MQYLPSCLREPIADIQAPSLHYSSALPNALADPDVFSSMRFFSPSVKPLIDACSKPWHTPRNIVNAPTTSSVAKQWLSVVSLSSWISGVDWWFLFSSPQSSRELVWFAYGINALCGPFCICSAINQYWLLSIARCLTINYGKPMTGWSANISDDLKLRFVNRFIVCKILNQEPCLSTFLFRHHYLAIEILGEGECWFMW